MTDLREQLDQARLKRAIVLSNYPTYKAAGAEIMRAFEQLRVSNQQIIFSLKRFGYTYDTGDITRAIEQSYDLADSVAKNRARLVQFRQVVESGNGGRKRRRRLRLVTAAASVATPGANATARADRKPESARGGQRRIDQLAVGRRDLARRIREKPGLFAAAKRLPTRSAPVAFLLRRFRTPATARRPAQRKTLSHAAKSALRCKRLFSIAMK